MAARKQPRSMARIFHIKGHKAYMVENSVFGIVLALLGKFRWIDMDMHVTKDGVVIFCHWGIILKDHMHLPKWFTDKYGNNPVIGECLWEDLKQLRGIVTYRGKKYIVQYRSVWEIVVWLDKKGYNKKIGIACEAKGDEEFEHKATWEKIGHYFDEHNVRHFMMTLSDIGGWYRRTRAAKAAGWKTTVLVRGPINKAHKDEFDYYRGKIHWVG